MITALVTLYYPNKANIENIIGISKQVDRLIVCDNTPNKMSLERFEGYNEIRYYSNGKNNGLSAAFNEVLKDTSNSWHDDDFIIFFDQDSKIPDGYIESLVREFQIIENAGHKIGCLGPVYFNNSNQNIEIPRQKKRINDHDFIVNSVITSSMLCKYSVLSSVGFWNEDVFLDLADWDLCWRMRERGYYSFKTDAVLLNHTLGTGEYRKGRMRIRYGAAIREYYQVRDGLYLMCKGYTPFKNRIRFLCGFLFRLTIHTRVLEEKEKRKKYIIRGWEDYKKHITGEYKEVADSAWQK